jgi:hypothetical protein
MVEWLIVLFNKREPPECIPWYSNYSLKHTLVHCVDVADDRQIFNNVNNFKICKINWFIYKNINIWFYLFNVSFICIYNPFVLWTSKFYYKWSSRCLMLTWHFFTPRYSCNTLMLVLSTKQSINTQLGNNIFKIIFREDSKHLWGVKRGTYFPR